MKSTKRILIIEDHIDLSNEFSHYFRQLNFDVTQCEDIDLGLVLAKKSIFDTIIVDTDFLRTNGYDFCRQLRASDQGSPVLMLTDSTSEKDKIEAFEIGVDDYLSKPVSLFELNARVNALIRRNSVYTNTVQKRENCLLEFDNIVINEITRNVTIKGQQITLTAKEFELLHFMAKNPAQVFRRDDLLNAVWGYSHMGYQHTVNSHINRLRNKIEETPKNPDFIHTVWGVGYMFFDKSLPLNESHEFNIEQNNKSESLRI